MLPLSYSQGWRELKMLPLLITYIQLGLLTLRQRGFSCNPTNTPRVFHVETTWKRPFLRRFNVEYMWCVCRDIDSAQYLCKSLQDTDLHKVYLELLKRKDYWTNVEDICKDQEAAAQKALREKCSKTELFSGPFFLVWGLSKEIYCLKTPYLISFLAV